RKTGVRACELRPREPGRNACVTPRADPGRHGRVGHRVRRRLSPSPVRPTVGLVIVALTDSRRAVAIVTGGAARSGGDIARGLASPAWAIVLVSLDHQSRAEETLAAIIASEAATVAVRADLADEFDVERLFSESCAAFGGVDVVVHTTPERAT